MYNQRGNMYRLQTKHEANMKLGKRQCREFGNKFRLSLSWSHFPVSCIFILCYHLWFNPHNSYHYLILGLQFIFLPPSSVIFGSTHCSSLESSPSCLSSLCSCISIVAHHISMTTFCHPSHPSSAFHLFVAPVIYTLGKVVMPLCGKASLCLVSSSWLSWVYHVPYPSGPLSGCAVYPMLVVSFPSLG